MAASRSRCLVNCRMAAERVEVDVEGAGELEERGEPRLAPPSLQQRDVGAMQPREEAERFLGDPPPLAHPAQVGGETVA